LDFEVFSIAGRGWIREKTAWLMQRLEFSVFSFQCSDPKGFLTADFRISRIWGMNPEAKERLIFYRSKRR
jgi:hypothetical protein